MTRTIATGRLLAALEGCYEAPRAAALSGVPISTVYYWARQGLIVPTVAPEKPKRWSYADLMSLRLVYWLRHPKTEGLAPIPASPMQEVRRGLAELDKLGLDIWSPEYQGPSSPVRVDATGRLFVVTEHGLETTHREGVLEATLDLLGPFETAETRGPNLIQPRPHLRIVPGKVSGEPHLVHSRITSQSVAALYSRFGSVARITELYPDMEPAAIEEAIDLENELAA